jgi:hypothetical protein
VRRVDDVSIETLAAFFALEAVAAEVFLFIAGVIVATSDLRFAAAFRLLATAATATSATFRRAAVARGAVTRTAVA